MKRKLFLLSLIAFVLALVIAGCQREGCTDPKATNYDSDAKKDNGTCVYATSEPTPVVPTREITLDMVWRDIIAGNVSKDTIKKYTDMEDVKFVFLNFTYNDDVTPGTTSTYPTIAFHTIRDTLQTRFDISPKVRGSGIIYVEPDIGAQIPDGTFGTGMNVSDSVWFADKGYQIKRYDPSAQ